MRRPMTDRMIDDESRAAATRTIPDLWDAIAHAIQTFTTSECRNYFAAAGYDAF